MNFETLPDFPPLQHNGNNGRGGPTGRLLWEGSQMIIVPIYKWRKVMMINDDE